MKKTIELTPNATKWIFLFGGVISSLLGYRLISQANFVTDWELILAVILMTAGPLIFVHAIVLFHGTNKLTPKVYVNRDEILVTNGIFVRQKKIEWKNVRGITFDLNEISFQLSSDKVEVVTLPTNAVTSMEIKRAIKQIADNKEINWWIIIRDSKN